MAPKLSDRGKKRDLEAIEVVELSAKLSRKPTQRLLESQQQFTPPPTQPESPPINASLLPSQPPQQKSPRLQPPLHPLFMGVRASLETPFESQIRDNKPKEDLLAREGSAAATEASDDLFDGAVDAVDGAEGVMEGLDRFADDFTGIDWVRLPGLMKPLSQPTRKKSWVYDHGYRCVMEKAPKRVFFICRICHQSKVIDRGGPGKYEVTDAITTPATHLRKHHNITPSGRISEESVIPNGQRSVRQMFTSGSPLPRSVANRIGNFDAQGFRMAAVSWLIRNNHPLHEFGTPAFKEMMEFANPEAARALWASHNSVSRFVMKVYSYVQPQVVQALSEAVSKIHISFDGWTAKGGHRGFLGVVAHFADKFGAVKDLPIALPQLAGSHAGEVIGAVVAKILQRFGLHGYRLGCFVLDNAPSNNHAVAKLAETFNFDAAERRIRCGCHIINLVGQQVMFGKDKESYNNAPSAADDEAAFMEAWRQEGPLGILFAVINYIKTPQQYALFEDYQRKANKDLPVELQQEIKMPVKPVVTRWNSFEGTLQRAVELRTAIGLYINDHRRCAQTDDELAVQRGKQPSTNVPSWMRSDGLTTADWQVIVDYLQVLKPLKLACERLEGRGKSGRFGAIYEVIPVFEYLLNTYEELVTAYEDVDYEACDAPEDHLAINVRAGYSKLADYYAKLDRSPYYFIATLLHPYYKSYCDNAWRNKDGWLTDAYAAFQRVWRTYKPQQPPLRRKPAAGSIDEAIDAVVNAELSGDAAADDEYDNWRKYEPRWTQDHYMSTEAESAVQYWLRLQPRYPHLAQLALDVLTIPASSCDCERMFSELGDLLEPRRRKMNPQLLAALQTLRGWIRAGFKTPSAAQTEQVTDEEVESEYVVNSWEDSAD
jgi:hypothetical protein